VGSEGQHPPHAIEGWLLHRAPIAVEAEQLSGELLAELHVGKEWARELSQEEVHALAVRNLTGRLGLPVQHAETMVAVPRIGANRDKRGGDSSDHRDGTGRAAQGAT
jgi:hypothetical protein